MLYETKYPKAVECLEQDRQLLLAFYDFPAEPWGPLRTTNQIESTFAIGPFAAATNEGLWQPRSGVKRWSSCWPAKPSATGDA